MSGDSSEPLNMLHDEPLGESAKTSEDELGEQTTPPLRGTLRGESLDEPSKMLGECPLTKLALRLGTARRALGPQSRRATAPRRGGLVAVPACTRHAAVTGALRFVIRALGKKRPPFWQEAMRTPASPSCHLFTTVSPSLVG